MNKEPGNVSCFKLNACIGVLAVQKWVASGVCLFVCLSEGFICFFFLMYPCVSSANLEFSTRQSWPWAHCVDRASPPLVVGFLPLPPEWWHCGCVPPHTAQPSALAGFWKDVTVAHVCPLALSGACVWCGHYCSGVQETKTSDLSFSYFYISAFWQVKKLTFLIWNSSNIPLREFFREH